MKRARDAVRRVVAHGLDLPDADPFGAIATAAQLAGADPGRFVDALAAALETQRADENASR